MKAGATRAPGLPYKTPYELLVAASLIEKETAVPEERKLISVINRLKNICSTDGSYGYLCNG